MGQCGQGHSQSPITRPKKVTGNIGKAPIHQISAGTSHSIAWTAIPSDRYICVCLYVCVCDTQIWIKRDPPKHLSQQNYLKIAGSVLLSLYIRDNEKVQHLSKSRVIYCATGNPTCDYHQKADLRNCICF
jgi:hypothetical protein